MMEFMNENWTQNDGLLVAIIFNQNPFIKLIRMKIIQLASRIRQRGQVMTTWTRNSAGGHDLKHKIYLLFGKMIESATGNEVDSL